MANKLWCVVADLSASQRSLLLRMFPPSFEDVYCYHVMWLYNPPDGADFPQGPIELNLTGHHHGLQHEALVGTLNGEEYRPDGKLVHVTLACAEGLPPLTAGDINTNAVEPISPVHLTVTLERRHPTKLRPERASART